MRVTTTVARLFFLLATMLAPAGAPLADPFAIQRVDHPDGRAADSLPYFALGDDVRVCLNQAAADETKWKLLLDGRAVTDDKSVRRAADPNCLLFTLNRSTATRDAWNAILGQPTTGSRSLEMAVTGPDVRLAAAAPVPIALLAPWRAFFSVVAGLLLIGLFIAHGRSTDLFRDNLLPQVPPMEQPYSLGRLQMGFWFVVIVVAFIFVWIYVGDYNSITPQALTLMGISAATGLGAIAANSFNNDDFKAAKAALVAAKFNTVQDVLDLRQMIESTQAGPDRAALQARLDLYNHWTTGYVSKDIWTDILSDDNGTALHRLQVVVWTAVLGGVFVWGVWQTLSMPAFSDTLLALMAVSGGSYVGFKLAEKA